YPVSCGSFLLFFPWQDLVKGSRLSSGRFSYNTNGLSVKQVISDGKALRTGKSLQHSCATGNISSFRQVFGELVQGPCPTILHGFEHGFESLALCLRRI